MPPTSTSRQGHTELVRQYYERHTRTFVRFGEGGALGAMHRGVFGPGVTTKAQAFRYIEDLIIGVATSAPHRTDLHVIDLGCGVGGSLCYLAECLPITGTGVTLSPTQAEIASARIAAAGLAPRLTVVVGDYTAVPHSVPAADVVFAVESFVHAPDAAAFFAQCRRLVRAEGALIICDDFLRGAKAPKALATIERFRRGWHAHTLLEPSALHALAHAAGFTLESTTDLSPYVDIGRGRDRLVDALAPSIERLPWRWSRLDPWLGGSALQACLRQGWLGYDFVVFRMASDQ